MRNVKIFVILILALSTTLLITGCESKKEEWKYDGKEGSVLFSLKGNTDYKLSTKESDLKSSKEEAMLLGKDFSIGIDFNDDLDYFYKGDFNALKKERQAEEDYKDVTYSNIKGIQFFYSGYMRYQVTLPIQGNNKYTLDLTVYGKEESEKAAKDAINNDEVKEILNSITSITVK